MNETMITFQGWLGSDVRTQQAGEATVATSAWPAPRGGSTGRRGSGHDGPTQWYTVNAWRASPTTAPPRCAAATRSWCTAG